jgi:hypothetical protein
MQSSRRGFWTRLKNRRGSVVLVGTGSLFVLASFGLFVMDVGQIFRQKRTAQTAADAGALAGAYEAYRASTSDSIRANAFRGTANNGFTDGTANVTVTVANPPTTGFYVGNSAFVEVNVKQTFPTMGLRFFGINNVPIWARAVAGGGGTAINCMFVTEPTGIAIDMENADITTTCGMSINSTNPSAINFEKNNASIVVSGGGRASVTGNVDFNGKSATISPSASTGVPPASDPLSSMTPPSFPSSCTFTNFSTNVSQTITPGTYCNGLKFDKGTITFTSGTYVLCGPINGMDVSLYTKGGNVIIRDDVATGGTGVTIVFTKCVVGGTTYNYARPMNMEASSDIVLHASTVAPYAGIAFYQDPRAPTTFAQSDWGASSTSNVFGMMYFPSTGINVLTGGAVLRTGSLVTRSIHTSAQSLVDITNNYNGAPPPFKRVTLVE